ncbi:hypothetical protein [uncultured Kordia sp.]|uniref:hypothetical protein n=1 Tax=uncultured Kordia sp. TaxID=507699 RepID=UPI002624EACC|nr:hypothetical protein [uncultured Kordia sp.]
MSNNKKKIEQQSSEGGGGGFFTFLLGMIAAGGTALAVSERGKRKVAVAKNKKLQQQNKELGKNNLKLISENIKREKGITEEVKEQLKNLQKNFATLSPPVAKELDAVVVLLENNQESTAIGKLTKVIENLLAEKLIKEGEIKKKPTLFKMLEKAFNLNWINKHEYGFANHLKEYRNKEAHELSVEIPKNKKIVLFLTAIDLIHTLEK